MMATRAPRGVSADPERLFIADSEGSAIRAMARGRLNRDHMTTLDLPGPGCLPEGL